MLTGGARINERYRIVRTLGEGGMGVVYEAFDESLARRVAVKVLLGSLSNDELIAQRFVNEARALATLRSEHIVEVYDHGRMNAGEHRGAPFMVMEFLSGRDLASEIERRGHLPYREAVGHVLQAMTALAQAHARGLVHRDLKPANLFLADEPDGESRIKVLDFGISKLTGEMSTGMTTDSAVLGTPAYMPPEQLRQSSSVDARADIWSMGVILYELITGELPFDGNTNGALFAAIIQDAPRPFPERAQVPPELAQFVYRCLEKSVAARWGTVAELARALGPFAPTAASELVARIERSASSRMLLDAAASHSDPTLAVSARTGETSQPPIVSDTSPRAARKRTTMASVGLIAAAALVGGVAALWRHPPDRSAIAPPVTQSAPPPESVTPNVATAPTVASASATAPRVKGHVRVVAPASVSVEIDGKLVSNRSAGVDVEGDVGSSHTVSLVQGDVVQNVTVVLRERGALPDAVKWSSAPAAAPVTKPTGSTATPPTGKVPTRPAPNPAETAWHD